MARLACALLLFHRFTEGAHALAQRFHRLRLIVDRLGQFIAAQRLSGAVHRLARAVQRVAGRVPLSRALPGQTPLLAAQLVAQCLLATGQPLLGPIFTGGAALPALAFMALAAPLPAVAAFVAVTLARAGAGIELLLQVAEGLIAQPLLLTQRVRQPLHRLLTGRIAALTRLAFGDAHVLHHFLQLAQRLGGFGHAALFHQLLNAVHHALQIVLGHLHRFALRLLVFARALLRLLPLKLLQIVFGGAAQLVHQLGDFGLRGTVLHRLVQPILRAAHPLKRIGQHAFFQFDRQRPEVFGQLGLHLFVQPVARPQFQPPDHLLEPQRRHLRTQVIAGGITHRAQHLRNARRICARPQKIAPHLNHRCRRRLEKTPPRQGQLAHLGHGLLFGGVQYRKLQRHREIGPWVFREILDQRLFEIAPVAADRHGQRHDDLRPRLGVDGQTIAAVDGGQIEADPRLSGFDAIVIARKERQAHLSQGGHLRRAKPFDLWHGIGQKRDLPRPRARPVDADLSALAQGEILRGLRGCRHLAA